MNAIDKPRRYVRVALVQRGIAGGRTRPWWRWDCICGVWGGKYNLADSHANATKHSGKCRTLRLAAERDQLRAALDTTRHLLWAALGAITERDET